MNRLQLKFLTCFAAGSIVFGCEVMPADAQSYSYYFNSFQCDPISCAEQGPPATQGSAEVNYYGVCTNTLDGQQLDISDSAIVTVGTNGPCSSVYTPYALAGYTTNDYTDANGRVYSLDVVTSTAEIFDASGLVVAHGDAQFGCDESVSGATGPVTTPC